MASYNPLPPLTNVPRSPTPDGANTSGSGTNTPDYAAQIAYWTSIPSTVSGMLGGYPQVSRVDLQTSSNFLAKLKPSMGVPVDGVRRGVDCGAGIGRITKGLLLKHMDVVDIVEPVSKFTEELLSSTDLPPAGGKIGEVFNVGLESWEPEEGRYWCIWHQWCLNHLTDTDLTSYLLRCSKALTQGGLIFVKENNSNNFEDVFDSEDSSVTRTDENFRRIFGEAGLVVVKSELQRGFPEKLHLFPVRMYALRPLPQPESGSGSGSRVS
ncbi:Alpha N-terminal protein methyltransferase 1 [Arthrobotrys conoides]|uniref:Alpha N-terminal protein methyltransferase 1 n=1 Tax=Arthrobotrys conoides TaxID=74498 RepID=A0AAN8RW01_9PEZI